MPSSDCASAAATTRAAPILISIEAIIGAGKSTLLEELDARSDVLIVREPVDLFQQTRGGDSLLDRYYRDQKANAFMFQTYAMMSTAEALRQVLCDLTQETRVVVMERSWLSARHCFVAHLQTLGHFDELEESLYLDLFNWGLEAWPTLDGVVFIDLPVGVAQDRVAKRGRMAESTIPSDYQEALSSRHRQWLHGDGEKDFEGPVLTLDGSMDRSDGAIAGMAARVMEMVEQLESAKHQAQGAPAKHGTGEILVDKVREPSVAAARKLVQDCDLKYHTPEKLEMRVQSRDGLTPVKRKATGA